MPRRSTLWWLSIGLSLVVTQSVAFGAGFDDGTAAGNDSGSLAIGRFGTKSSVNQNISMPMTNSDSKMQTVDGSVTFNGSLTAPSSSKFLEVTIQPSGTGDLSFVLISQDTNNDGHFDNVHTLPIPVSGVCANGFISCTPGTWIGCQPYTWKADSDGNVAEASAPITSLGGCYCINSSCGSNLVWQNSGIVLKDVGGGIVTALRSNDPTLMITSVKSDLTTITYYGQATSKVDTGSSSISALNSSPQISSLAEYSNNPAGFTTLRDNMTVSESNDPNSFYSMIANSVSAQNKQGKMSTCAVNRVAGISNTSNSFIDSGASKLYAHHGLGIKIQKSSDGSIYKLKLLDNCGPGIGNEHYKSGTHPNHEPVDTDNWHILKTIPASQVTSISQTKMTAANFSVQITGGAGCYVGVTASVDALIQGFDTRVDASVCDGDAVRLPTFNWSYFIEYSTDTFNESIDNGCQALESDPTCVLSDEEIDGVVTHRNFNPTGLSALGSCRDYNGLTEVMQYCRPWWNKKRTYVCQSDGGYDFSDVGKRFGQVVTSTQQGGAYTDLSLGKDGTWQTSSWTFSLPPKSNYPTCEPACKTRKTSQDTQVGIAGSVSTIREAGADSYEFAYRVCTNNVCPAEAGEEIILDCQCINEFAEAAVIIQTLRLSGKDNICSSGEKSPMKTR